MFSIQLRKLQEVRLIQPNSIFFDHLDRALDSFGATFKSVVYFNFCQEHKLAKKDIALHPDLFVQTIDKLFGVSSGCVKSIIGREMREASPLDLGKCDTAELLRKVSHYYEINCK